MTQPRMTIEVGHTYSPNRLVSLTSMNRGDFYSPALNRHFNDTPEAAQVRSLADSFGDTALRVALIDDIIPKNRQAKSEEDGWRWQLFMNTSTESVRIGADVDPANLYFESTFEAAGRGLVQQIQAMDLPDGMRLSQAGDKLKIGSGKNMQTIRLQGYAGIEDPSFPSCEILDLAWLQKRLTLAPEAVTALPDSFSSQQARVDILANVMGIDPATHSTILHD